MRTYLGPNVAPSRNTLLNIIRTASSLHRSSHFNYNLDISSFFNISICLISDQKLNGCGFFIVISQESRIGFSMLQINNRDYRHIFFLINLAKNCWKIFCTNTNIICRTFQYVFYPKITV